MLDVVLSVEKKKKERMIQPGRSGDERNEKKGAERSAKFPRERTNIFFPCTGERNLCLREDQIRDRAL